MKTILRTLKNVFSWSTENALIFSPTKYQQNEFLKIFYVETNGALDTFGPALA
jgi:hypothetical protein